MIQTFSIVNMPRHSNMFPKLMCQLKITPWYVPLFHLTPTYGTLCVRAYILWHTWGHQWTTFGGLFSPTTMCILRIKIKYSVLIANAFTQRASLLASTTFQIKLSMKSSCTVYIFYSNFKTKTTIGTLCSCALFFNTDIFAT